MNSAYRTWKLFALALVVILLVALRLSLAPTAEGGVILRAPQDRIEWSIRGPRVAAGLCVGASLAVAGVFLQSLLRNPLAAPSVLGVSAGASFAVVFWIYLGFLATGAVAPHRAPTLAALAGGLSALVIVHVLGQRRGRLDPVSLILTGVVVSVTAGAATAFVLHLLPGQGALFSTRWMLGAISDEASWRTLIVPGALLALALALGLACSSMIDASALDETEAVSVGVPIEALRLGLFLLAGALAAGAVTLAGPVSFVGLICPHAARAVLGPRHRALIPGAALAGAALLLAADSLVRLIDLGAGRIPVGAVTALVGGPAFIWVLRRLGRPS